MTKKKLPRRGRSLPREKRAKRPPATPGAAAPAHADPVAANRATPNCAVVGVGASAGGLEAFAELLSEIPVDTPLALVLIQHLDPKHESALAGLLARTTLMPVVEVKHGMAVAPARVYVIPPNASMTIANGVLSLGPRSSEGSSHTIDHFLRSLAKDCGSRAIGVVLSGSASDGALGLTAIKAAGGLTFAQDPDSAKFDGMPQSAVASGAVDFVLPPTAIGRELARLARHPYVRTGAAAAAPAEQAIDGKKLFDEVFRMVQRETGVDFTQYRQTTLRRRIARRMTVHKLDTFEDYRRHLQEHPAEVHALYNDLLINVTGFFRDAAAFRVLQRSVFPKIIKRLPAATPIRVWASGCATGEETYSLAIALLESCRAAAREVPIQIFGTDVSTAAIAKARAGLYPPSIALDVSPERLRRFFVRQDGQYQVRKSVRELCVFAKHDLAKDPPFSNVDLISCRNVLIYFEPPLQKRVMAVLHYALKNNGFLLLGPSETVGPLGDLFAVVDKKHKLYAKKATTAWLDVSLTGLGRAIEKAEVGKPADRTAQRHPWSLEDLQRQVDRIVLSRHTPAGVVVNDAMDVLLFRGHSSPYLEPAPGQPNLNVLKMAREGLFMELRQAIAQVRKANAPVRREGLRIKRDGTFGRVDLEVIPVTGPSGERNYVILFEETPPSADTRSRKKAARDAPPSGGRTTARAQFESLRHELTETKEFLQSIIQEREAANEELRSANEEILSSNEELQSTNEELETTKEELQSTNEELTTLHEEAQHRNADLNQLSNDLINLFASVDLPILIVGVDLRLRRFTPMAAELFNLIPGDVGRPVRSVKPNLDLPELEELCERAIDAMTVTEQEVTARGGRWYSLRVRPYRTADNQIDGAMVTLVDITALKTNVEEVTTARESAEAVVDTVREPLLILDGTLRVKSASRSFYETFQVAPEVTVNQFVYDLGNRQWDIPALRVVLRDVVEKNARFEDFEVKHDFEGIGRRMMLLNARQIHGEPGAVPTILLAIEDVTARKEAERRLGAARTKA